MLSRIAFKQSKVYGRIIESRYQEIDSYRHQYRHDHNTSAIESRRAILKSLRNIEKACFIIISPYTVSVFLNR